MTKKKMIKNIIFDLGNVLLYGNPVDIVDNLIVSESNKDVIKSTFFSNWEKLDIGKESLVDHFINCQFSTQIDEDTKADWQADVMELEEEVIFDKNETLKGKELYVFIEGKVADENAYIGRTYRDAPNVDGYIFINTDETLMTGDICKVMVTGAYEYDLIGELVK